MIENQAKFIPVTNCSGYYAKSIAKKANWYFKNRSNERDQNGKHISTGRKVEFYRRKSRFELDRCK